MRLKGTSGRGEDCLTIQYWTIGARPQVPGACWPPIRTDSRANRALVLPHDTKKPLTGRGRRADGRRQRCHRRSWTGHRASARANKEEPNVGNRPGAAHRTGAGRSGTSHGVANLGAHHGCTIPPRRTLRGRRRRRLPRETVEVYRPIVGGQGSAEHPRPANGRGGETGDRATHTGTDRRGTTDCLADGRDPGRMAESRPTSSHRATPTRGQLPLGSAHPAARSVDRRAARVQP